MMPSASAISSRSSAGKRARTERICASLQPHLLLVMEQPPEQILERERRVGQFAGAHGLAEDADMVPFRMVEPGVQPLAPLLALGQVLEQDAARDAPAVAD